MRFWQRRRKKNKKRFIMSGLRRSTRANTSTINVKLNDKNEIEYFKVEDEIDDDDVGVEHVIVDNDDVADDIDEEAEIPSEEEEEEEEEVIVNADGTMSIKIPEKKPKPKKVPVHHICAKCSRVLSSGAVSTSYLGLVCVFKYSDVISRIIYL